MLRKVIWKFGEIFGAVLDPPCQIKFTCKLFTTLNVN